MNLGITGATGLIGQALVDRALRRGHEVIAFSRHPERALPGCTMRLFSNARPPDFGACDAVVHLAAESIAGLWTPGKKQRIRQSRVLGTRLVAEGLQAGGPQPEVLVCGSAIGYYGETGERETGEDSPAGTGFLAEVTAAWEAEVARVQGVRTVLLRTAPVLAKGGGALGAMGPLFRWGLGGRLGSGQQWMSWIHLEDEVRLILFAIENLDVSGPLNAAAPWPVRNAEFTQVLAEVLRRPAIMRVPAFALRMLGDLSSELLGSKRILPAAALDHGFGFQYPELRPALQNLVG